MKVVVQAEVAGHVRTVTVDVKSTDTVESVVNSYAKSVRKKSPFRGGQPVLYSESGAELQLDEQLDNLNIKEGTTVFLRVKSRKERLTRNCKCCLCWSFLALFAFGGGVIAVVLLQQYWGSSHHYRYGIVIDAGSSHTSLRVYRWPGEKENDTGIVKQHKKTCHSDGGAISQYVDEPSEAGPSLKGCLEKAKDIVPHDKRSDTPIYLGATAGMRILNETNVTAATAIMESIRNFIKSYPFFFNPEQASIISGQVEGVSGWITINYLQNKLFPKSTLSQVMAAVGLYGSNSMSGALDLGGASEQITFVPQNLPSHGRVDLRLYGQNYTVYTHSYLCFGRNEANRQLLASLVKDSNYKELVVNPCAQRGFVSNIPSSDVFKEPCTPPDRNLPNTFQFSGFWNSSQCGAVIQSLFNASQFKGVYLPAPVGAFYAFSGFADAAGYLNRTTPGDLGEWRDAADRICNYSWAEIVNMKFENDYLKNMSCFLAQYIYYNLVKGFNMSENSTQVQFQDDIDDTSLGWALGFMINATNMLPSEAPSKLMSSILFGELVGVFGFLFFITVFSLLMWCWRRKCHNRSGYVTLTEIA